MDQGADYGDSCALFYADGELSVLYRRTNRLSVATRAPDGQWQIADIDNIGSVGHGVHLTELRNGYIVAAHRDDSTGNLRVSWRDPQGQWENETAVWPNPAGMRPRIVPSGDAQVRIFHGLQNVSSDGGLLMTQGTVGALESSLIIQGEAGGSTGAALMSGQNLLVVTRELRRNAVFGDFDGLRIYRELPANFNFEYLEQWDANAPRRTIEFLDLSPDPFGMPVLALRDGPTADVARLCFWRAADRDGDRLPDMVEAWAESDPDNPDTDGDGRLDGDEAMAGDNPAGAGPLRPGLLIRDGQAPPPRPDMGMDPVPPEDAGPPLDAAFVQDAAPPPLDATLPDADVDAAVADAGQTVDAGLQDMAPVPDQALGDMNPPPSPPDAMPPAPDVAAPPLTDAGDAAVSSSSMSSDDDGGCSITHQSTPAVFGLLLLGLGVRRRRRSRAP